MGYALPANLSFCLTGGRAIFLDLARDRYFRLGVGPDAAFQALVLSGHTTDADAAALTRFGVIQKTNGDGGIVAATGAAPMRSALETEPAVAAPGVLMTLQVAHAVARSWLALKRTPIAEILARLRQRRERAQLKSGAAKGDKATQAVLTAAMQFHRARRRIPINTVCLLDSLALVDFLARRGLFANLVLGVKLNPFVAHSWVQYRDVILNDPFDRASAHTPILVI